MSKIVFLEKAKQEFKDALLWYDDSAKDLGKDFEKIVLAKIEQFEIFPTVTRLEKRILGK